jgi:hypothetical protein
MASELAALARRALFLFLFLSLSTSRAWPLHVSHLLTMTHFLLLLLLFLLSLFPLNHAKPPLPCIMGFSLDVALVEVGLLSI